MRHALRAFALLLIIQSTCGSQTSNVQWNPLVKQNSDADTTFLLDGAIEQSLTPGVGGGFIAGNPHDSPWSKVAIVDGKYRKGFKTVNADNGYVWMPGNGLLPPTEFTIEFWVKSDVALIDSGYSGLFADYDITGLSQVAVFLGPGSISVDFGHSQGVSPISIRLSANVSTVQAGEWVNVAVTYKDATVRLYVNGVLRASAVNLPAPHFWSDSALYDGLSLLGGYVAPAVGVTISDLRISRRARTPEVQTTVSGANTVTVQNTSVNDPIRKQLLGGLHDYNWNHTAEPVAAEQLGQGTLQVLRTDKLLVATPIKAGAPDADHPTQGTTGRYSYDWQVVDRTFDYYQRLGVTPYISIDSTPQILGGSVAPFSGAELTTLMAAGSSYSKQVPNDLDAFGAIVQDLVYHVIRERHYSVPYWGVWNEPDYYFFWAGTLNDYLSLYRVCAIAVKAVDPSLKVGGPETSTWQPSWTKALMQYCAQNSVPLDFVSWHYYEGNPGLIWKASAQIDAWTTLYGLPKTPEKIVGEWCWNLSNLPGALPPWGESNFFLNDWHAGFAASTLIEMQKAGIVKSIYTNPVGESTGLGIEGSGLMSSTHAWANLNIFRMWNMLAADRVLTTLDAAPGISAIASRSPGGQITVFISNLNYRKGPQTVVSLKLSGFTLRSQSLVTVYSVDDTFSNQYDAGPAHTNLEVVARQRGVFANTVRAAVRSRGATLVVIDP